MLDLTRITLCAISSIKIAETLKALDISQSKCLYNNTIFFTDQNVKDSILIPKINNIKEYNSFVFYTLPELVLPHMADFLLTIQWDGFVVNPASWSNDFYNYDYIGAPWPWFNNMVGNGGFCLKSKKFLEAQKEICKTVIIKHNEDVELCLSLRNRFESYGCKYADKNIGYKFSTEYGDINKNKSFGFHDFKYNPQYKHMILS